MPAVVARVVIIVSTTDILAMVICMMVTVPNAHMDAPLSNLYRLRQSHSRQKRNRCYRVT